MMRRSVVLASLALAAAACAGVPTIRFIEDGGRDGTRADTSTPEAGCGDALPEGAVCCGPTPCVGKYCCGDGAGPTCQGTCSAGEYCCANSAAHIGCKDLGKGCP